MRVAYVNGCYLKPHEAKISIHDRGYQFGDGIYEVIAFKHGHLIDEELHFNRLDSALQTLKIRKIFGVRHIVKEILRREKPTEGLVYIQATRGIFPRLHRFPSVSTQPSLVIYFENKPVIQDHQIIKVISLMDERSGNLSSTKTLCLLPNVLARQTAYEQGAFEAVLTKNGYVIEGASSNLFIVEKGLLITPPADGLVAGVCRQRILSLAQKLGVPCREEAITMERFYVAQEVFLTQSSNGIRFIGQIDDHMKVAPGPISQKLFDAYKAFAQNREKSNA